MDVTNKSKIACFDLEGTLVKGNIWKKLGRKFGVKESKTDEIAYKFMRGEIRYNEWIDSMIKEWKSGSGEIPTKKNIEEATEDIRTRKCAMKTIRTFKENGYYTISISGTPDVYSSKVSKMLGINRNIPTHKCKFDKGEVLTDIGISKGYEFSKGYFIDTLKNKNSVDHIVAIGDDQNDLDMCEKADIGFIVKNPEKEGIIDYNEIANKGIIITNLTELPERIQNMNS